MTEYGVMMTPAIVVDGKIKIEGKVPTENDIEKIIKEIIHMNKPKIHKKCFHCVDCGRNCKMTYLGATPRFCSMCGSKLEEIKSIKRKGNLLIVKYE